MDTPTEAASPTTTPTDTVKLTDIPEWVLEAAKELVRQDADAEYVPMPPTDTPAPDKAPGQVLEEWLRGTISLMMARWYPQTSQAMVTDSGKPALVVANEHGTFIIRVAKVSSAVVDHLH